MVKILSICIPTYNRKEKLKRLVDSICSQSDSIKDKIEICVSDNASTDGTKQYLNELREKLPFVVKTKFNEVNEGMDANIISSLELGNGEFLWILGDDDYPSQGSLKKLVSFLDRITADKNINLIYLRLDRESFEIDEGEKIISSVEMVKEPNGFMSTNIVRRSAFEHLGHRMICKGIGSGYEHAWIIRLLGIYLPNSKAICFQYPTVCSENSHHRTTLAQQMKFEKAFFYIYTQIFWNCRNAPAFRKYRSFFLKKVMLTMFFPFFEMLCERVFRPNGKENLEFGFFVRIFNAFGPLLWFNYRILKITPHLIVKQLLRIAVWIVGTLKLSRDSNWNHWQRFWETPYETEVTEKRDFFK